MQPEVMTSVQYLLYLLRADAVKDIIKRATNQEKIGGVNSEFLFQ